MEGRSGTEFEGGRPPGRRAPERAVLVGLRLPKQPRWEAEEALGELQQLTRSAGANPCETVLQERQSPDPRTFIGSGKVDDLRRVCANGVDLVIFDDDLSGTQQRNLEERIGCRVIDRTGLILDIFAQRARTKEGKLQVELAQLQYFLPRLTGQWSHLERLGGGIGTRGPGETQLEVDRRRIRHRIAKIQEELKKVRRHRALLRSPRKRRGVPTAALVGYTSAGKSSLLNALTGAGVAIAGRLFSTLDPTTRQVVLPGGGVFLLTDTVGFIRKLPHQLVVSFKATLEEVVEADILLHVINAAHPHWPEQRRSVEGVLGELGVLTKPTLTVYNKVDLLDCEELSALQRRRGKGHIAVSAKTGAGLTELLEALANILADVSHAGSGGVPAGAGA
ncbi:MAG: GTPase HflX [Candidatus Methylomirabilales bacterium]